MEHNSAKRYEEEHLEDSFFNVTADSINSRIQRAFSYKTFKKQLFPEFDFAKIENKLSENDKATIEQYSAFFKLTQELLPDDHESVTEVTELVNDLLAEIDFPSDTLKVLINQSPLPNAEISVYTKEIRISNSLLESLDYRKDLLKAVLAHEIGHLVLSHYEVILDRNEIDDIVLGKVYSYENEYQADRVSMILMSRSGENPLAIKEALLKIHKYCDKTFKYLTKKRVADETSEGLFWALNSHPFIKRRISILESIARKFISNKKQSENNSVKKPEITDFKILLLSNLGFQNEYSQIYGDPICDDFTDIEIPNHVNIEFQVQTNEAVLNFDDGLKADFLDVDPKNVNKWTEKNVIEIQSWWEKAVNNLLDIEGFEDLKKDISSYTSETIKLLFFNLPIEKFYEGYLKYCSTEDICLNNEDEVLLKLEKTKTDLFLGLFHDTNLLLIHLDALLIAEWLKQFNGQYTEENLEKIFKFLREFRIKKGYKIPYSGIRILDFVLNTFYNCKTDTERFNIANICYEYMIELNPAGDNMKFAFKYMEPINNWLKKNSPTKKHILFSNYYFATSEHKFNEEINGISLKREISFGRAEMKIEISDKTDKIKFIPETGKLILPFKFTDSDFPEVIRIIKEAKFFNMSYWDYAFNPDFSRLNEEEWFERLKTDIQTLIRNKDIPKDQIKDFLKTRLPEILKSKNISFNIAQKIGENYLGEEHDRIRESDPAVAANIMETDEFEEQFFGNKRNNYRKFPYKFIHSGYSIYETALELWERSGYEQEMEKLDSKDQKMQMLLETMPFKCVLRDQLIVKILGIGNLEYLDDVMGIQEALVTIREIKTLSLLVEAFFHPLLVIKSSQQLWAIKNKLGTREFINKCNISGIDSYKDLLKGYPFHLINDELIALIICFPYPSYIRDELLKGFIDKASDEKDTQAITSFLLDPPPGIIKPRRLSVVAVSETVLDALKHLEDIDKEEAMLYLLGHRFFYSGIDGKLMLDEKEAIWEKRKEMLYSHNPKKILEKDNKRKVGKYEKMYICDIPDSIIILSKYCGLPSEMIFDQGKIATTRREQQELIKHILLGEGGILNGENADKFLNKCADLIVRKGQFSDRLSEKEQKSMKKLLSLALRKCPWNKLPDLFLDCLYITGEKEIDLPNLVANLMQKYGAAFIKAGQYLATQTASLPFEWIKVFRTLSDQNAEGDKTLLYDYVSCAYGNDSPFEALGEKIAEGSMAAVYKGKLRNGKSVAVKVIHPWIEREIDQDIKFLQEIVDFINANKDLYNVSLPVNLGDVTRNQLKEEVSVANEAQNNDLLKTVLSTNINGTKFKLPEYFPEYCNEYFYITEHAEGVAMDEEGMLKEMNLDSNVIKNAVGIEILRQILEKGIYQADPNMGNFKVSVDKDGEPVVNWLDTGHIGKLTKQERKLLINFISNLIGTFNVQNITEIIVELLTIKDEKAHELISKWIEENINFSNFQITDIEVFFKLFLDFCAENNYVLKETWVRLFRTFGLLRPLLEGSEKELIISYLLPLFNTMV